MSIVFKPTGTLNISTSPSDLPEQAEGSSSISGAMTRCKNLTLDRDGRADTRYGSTTRIDSVMSGISSFLIEQIGIIYAFVSGQIYQNGTSIKSNLSSGDWSAIKYNSFNDTTQRIFALNGNDRKKITSSVVEEWGIEAPSAVPTLGTGAGTGLTGAYNVKYTYARKSGSTVIAESNPSSAAASTQSLTNQSLSVTFTASADPQVTHVRVYRTIAGGSEYFLDQDVAVGTTTLDTSTADASLGAEVAIDHDRPPLGTLVLGPLYNGVCFIAVGNLLYYCLAKQPEYWPSTYFIEVGPPQFPILEMVILDGNLYCLTKNQIWFIQGVTSGAFNPVPIEALTGCGGRNQAVAVKGHGIFHVGEDGIYLYVAGRDKKITEDTFDPIFRGQTVNGMEAVTGNKWLIQFENKLYFHYGNGSVLVLNIDSSKSRYYKYDQALYSPTIDFTNSQLLAGTHDKKVRRLENPSYVTDAGSSFAWEVQTKDFTLQTRAHYPRFVKYDVDGTATGELLLDGESHQTHSLAESRNTKRRLVKTGNGNRMSMRVSGDTSNGAATIYALEAE